ncbi:hypothetical protein [Thiolapillus brandeum]|uniref:hypothetical protein n=1 Tax=Thiolapillus brandeum TaxID=1076588 RepID=UPI00059717A3|nr:hypothetical protein [Thiolapillus brandeum]
MNIYRSVVAVTFLTALSGSAFAYIDPGTGSMVLQMAVAGILAGLFYIKMAWSRIKQFFVHLFTRGKAPVSPPDGEARRNSDED